MMSKNKNSIQYNLNGVFIYYYDNNLTNTAF